MEYFHYQDQQLHAEGVNVSAIAEQVGTPTYVYSRAALESALQEYQQALAGCPHLVCFAVKANSNLAVLDTLARLGAGFDIVSVGELERVVAAGGDPGRTVFSGVSKQPERDAPGAGAGYTLFQPGITGGAGATEHHRR